MLGVLSYIVTLAIILFLIPHSLYIRTLLSRLEIIGPEKARI